MFKWITCYDALGQHIVISVNHIEWLKQEGERTVIGLGAEHVWVRATVEELLDRINQA